MTTARQANARRVLQTIQQGCAGLVELRAIPARTQVFAPIEDRAALTAFVQAHLDTDNLYWALATRRDASSGRAENCQHLGALFADVDFGKSSEDAARSQLAAFGLSPSILIHSGGGLHAYWLLDTPLDVAGRATEIKSLLRRLARAVGGDLVVAEVARVLRIPGTLNHKHVPPVLVTVEVFEPERRYPLSAIVAQLPEEPAAAIRPIIIPPNWTPPAATADRHERGRAYLLAMGPAIEGSGGDLRTFRAACWLVNDLALDEPDALRLLTEWNAGCCPPWTDRELREKVQHARRYGHHPLGAALVGTRASSLITVRVQVR
jgi:hypothetical protein